MSSQAVTDPAFAQWEKRHTPEQGSAAVFNKQFLPNTTAQPKWKMQAKANVAIWEEYCRYMDLDSDHV